jgi:hypothetical protein
LLINPFYALIYKSNSDILSPTVSPVPQAGENIGRVIIRARVEGSIPVTEVLHNAGLIKLDSNFSRTVVSNIPSLAWANTHKSPDGLTVIEYEDYSAPLPVSENDDSNSHAVSA